MKGKLPPLRLRLDEERKKVNVQLNILEQDYISVTLPSNALLLILFQGFYRFIKFDSSATV